jgi:hypothetical protein
MHTSKTGKKAIKSSETSSTAGFRNPEQKTILPNARNENRGRTDMAVAAYGSDCHAAVTFTRFFLFFVLRLAPRPIQSCCLFLMIRPTSNLLPAKVACMWRASFSLDSLRTPNFLPTGCRKAARRIKHQEQGVSNIGGSSLAGIHTWRS